MSRRGRGRTNGDSVETIIAPVAMHLAASQRAIHHYRRYGETVVQDTRTSHTAAVLACAIVACTTTPCTGAYAAV